MTAVVPAELRTARLFLRPWQPTDAPALLPVLEVNREHLGPWIPPRVAEPVPIPALEQRLAGFAADFDANREWRYGMFSLDDGTLLGEVGLFPRNASGRVPFDTADRVEVGYWLRCDETGRGLVTEAVRVVLDVAASIQQFSQAEIRCDARNAPSGAVAKRLGFALTTTIVDGPPDGSDESVHLQVWTSPVARRPRLEQAAAHLVTSLILVVALAGCARSTPVVSNPAAAAVDRKALLLDPSNPEWRKPAPPVSHLRFETTKGVFVLELIRDWAPIGADRLYNLARLGYYDDTRFHRVNRNYIAQFGLHGDPAVNAAWKDRYVQDDPPRSDNKRGTFAFAMKGAANRTTRNTQIYINLADNTRSDAEPFTILGRVVEGMAVVDSLYSGYGENSGSGVRQGRQGPLETGGNAYMDREYPLLDRIRRVTVTTVTRNR